MDWNDRKEKLEIGLSTEEVRYSEVRKLSALDYAHGHNIEHSMQPATYTTRKPFQWNPGIIMADDRVPIDNGDHTKTNMEVSVTQINQKKSKTKKNKGNIWWPWANYEDWLANNERKDNQKDTLILLNSDEKLVKRARTSKRKRKQRKDSQFSNKFRSRYVKHKKNRTKESKELNPVPPVMIVNQLGKVGDKKSSFTSESVLKPKIHSSDVEKKYSLLKKPVDNQRFGSFKSHHEKTAGYLTNNTYVSNEHFLEMLNNEIHIPNNNIIQGMDTFNRFHPGSDEDNEIKKIYNNLPYWKESIIETASRNYPSDENECLRNNGGCEGLCINTKGSYRCHCPPGFRLDSFRTRCLDVNECLSRNGHGPCDGECINTWGSYECGCQGIPGTTLASDGQHCQPLDNCAVANCSHACIPTRAGPFCSCPLGLELSDDWKTCTDVNECADVESNSCTDKSQCINTFGSYRCSPDV